MQPQTMFPQPGPAPESQAVSPIFGVLFAFMLFGGWMAWSESFNGAKYAVFVFVLAGWIVSLCLHEFAHARTAYWAGDRSVEKRGYLTLNPLKYVHPGLSLLLPIAILLIGGIGLPGGAVYINMGAIRDPRKRSMVSLAGPAANFLCGLICALPFIFARGQMGKHLVFAAGLAFLALLQFISTFLNLLPLPGLDGFGAIEPFLSRGFLQTIAPYRGYTTLLLFFGIFRIRAFSDLVFGNAYRVASALRIPEVFALAGRELFRFWRQRSGG